MKNINYKNKPLLIITLGSLLIIGMTGCKKFVEVEPPVTSITGENVFTNDATAIAVLTGIYAKMSTSGSFTGSRRYFIVCGIIGG